jgi:hypothetical protein
MVLKPTSPEEYNVQLGKLRLWRDDIETIVALVRQMPNVEITLEADHLTLDDLTADLPQCGRRVEYFKLTARTEADKKEREVLRLQLGGCRDSDIETRAKNPRLFLDRDRLRATDPDLGTRAVINDIMSFTRRHRRRMGIATILNTGTHAEAPTWWQEYRSHVGIGVVTGAVFYVLGLLTAHL